MLGSSVRLAAPRARYSLLFGCMVALAGCPGDDASPRPLLDGGATADVVEPAPAPADASAARRPTHSGLVSIQEVSILDQTATGLTVQALLTPAVAPTYEERPGDPTGCKAWSYDLTQRQPPPEQDHGTLHIAGLREGGLTCSFVAGRGYACAASEGSQETATGPFLPRSLAETPLSVALTPGGERGFALPETPVTPGQTFEASDASRALLQHLPLDGSPVTLGCAGEGGRCGPAQATIVRITATDAPTAGLAPTAMPRALKRYVEISCAVLGQGELRIPAEAMALLREADRSAPLTRIRTALMRDGVAIVTNPPPAAPNRVVVAAGRALIGFTDRP